MNNAKITKTKIALSLFTCTTVAYVLLTIMVLPIIGIQMFTAFIKNPVPAYATTHIDYRRETKEELPMREWVLKTVQEAGLNLNEADCLIQEESGWDNWRYNVNKDGSTDFGLWQINSVHKDSISVECRWDYKCATYWAIQKRLNVGHWNDWYGYTNNCR